MEYKEALAIIAQHYGLGEEVVDTTLIAASEGRVRFTKKYSCENCGTCQNFNCVAGGASGYCAVRKRKPRYNGDPPTLLFVSRSRKACLDYKPRNSE